MKKYFSYAGYKADVLTEDKYLSFWKADGKHVAISMRPERRLTKKKIEKILKRYPGVDCVYTRHTRYISYRLRNVMKTKSGSYTVWYRHDIINGKIVNTKHDIKDEVY